MSAARLARFLLSQDRLGHRFSLNYKGKESHNTVLGTALSLAINILVLIILGQKAIDMHFMRDPTVQVNTRPIFKEEVDEVGLMHLRDYKMQIGFAYEIWYYDESAWSWLPSHYEPIPP